MQVPGLLDPRVRRVLLVLVLRVLRDLPVPKGLLEHRELLVHRVLKGKMAPRGRQDLPEQVLKVRRAPIVK